jgi:tetratricopeptide (TPR) repeat protein
MRCGSLLAGVAALCLTACFSKVDYVERGNQYLRERKFEDAALNFRNALKADQQNGQAFHGLGETYLQQKRYREAYPALKRAAELLPDEPVQVKLANLCLASYLSTEERPAALFEQVRTIAARLIERNRQSYDGLRLTAHLHLIEKRPKQALEFFAKANEVRPFDTDLVLAWVQALAENGQPQEAEKQALLLVEKRRTFGFAYNFLHLLYQREGRIADAESILERKIRAFPKDEEVLIQLCRHYHDQGKKGEVTGCVNRLFSDAGYNYPHLHAGGFYRSLGNIEEAERFYRDGLNAARRNAPARPRYQKALARLWAATGKFTESAAALEEILQQYPQDAEARLLLASVLQDGGKMTEALPHLEKLAKEFPADSEVHFRLGRVQAATGKAAEARKSYQEAIRHKRGYAEPRLALGELEARQGDYRRAKRSAEEVVALTPNDVRARLLRTATWIGLREFGQAQTELGKILQEQPDNREAQFQRAMLSLAQEKHSEAEGLIRRIYEAGDRSPRVLTAWAETYAGRSQYDAALKLLREKATGPANPELERSIAAITARSGRYPDAIRLYEELLAKEPGAADLHLRLGEAYQLGGQSEKAAAAFQKAVQLQPGDAVPSNALALTQIALGKRAEAQELYRQVLAKEPDNAIALNNLAFLLADEGKDLDKALEMAARACRLAPAVTGFKDTVGWIYLKQQKTESAIQVFKSLVRTAPESATYRYHLGSALLAKGEKQAAKEALEEALKRGPVAGDDAKVRELLKQL